MDGIIIINKSKGFTSHDVINVVRKAFNLKKVGHTGTLDPNATGVLPILLGNATKISKYLIEHKKEYIATIYLGEKRSTGDAEGDIIEKDDKVIEKVCNFSEEKLTKILESFLGKQKQVPPIYSAIKVNGKKAYEYARKGQVVNISPREIEIFKIELISIKLNLLKFKVECSKGTYIRTLCEDIAKKIGTVGYMYDLIRTKVDKFGLENSLTIEDIKNNSKKCESKIISIEKVFEENKEINISQREKELFLNGVQLTVKKQNGVYKIYTNKQFIGLGVVNNNLLKRDVVI